LSSTKTENTYYFYCVWLGFGSGYWAMFVTVASEQFGTNLRSTTTTTVPNMVRGLVPGMLFLFNHFKPSTGVISAAILVGLLAFTAGIYSTLSIEETHNKDMDFVE
jgi:hypothetical protein